MERIDPTSVAMGKAVRAAIVQSDLTNAKVAEHIGIAVNSFSRRINGHSPFTWPELFGVAAVTGVTTSELVANAERILGRVAGDAA